MLKLILNNKDGTLDISQLTQNIVWSGDYQQCSRSLNFSLLSSPVDNNIPAVKCELGNAVTLMQDNVLLFEGFVFSRQKSTDGNLIDISCYDRGFYLKKNKSSYKFTNTTPEAIAKRVAADYGFEVGEIATTGFKLSRNFLGTSLYEIIQTAYTLASASNKKKYLTVFRGSKLCVIEKKITNTTLVVEGGSNLINTSTSESIENMINQVGIYSEKDKLIRTIKNENAIKLYGVMQDYLQQQQGVDSGKEAQKLLDENDVNQKITIENLGNIANVTGGTVIVHEPYTGLYGLFYIDSDTHSWKNRLYLNKLVVNFKNIMDKKEVGSIPNKS